MPSPYTSPSLTPRLVSPTATEHEAPSWAEGPGCSTGPPPEALSQARRLRVIAVDDHPAIRDAIADTVAGQPDMELCGVAGSANEAFDLVRRTRPHVAVVDISLGDAHGLDLVQNLRAQHPELEVVVFSMYDEAVYAERAIRAGARGYVMKSESTQSVVEAVRSAAQGKTYRLRRPPRRLLSRLPFSALALRTEAYMAPSLPPTDPPSC